MSPGNTPCPGGTGTPGTPGALGTRAPARVADPFHRGPATPPRPPAGARPRRDRRPPHACHPGGHTGQGDAHPSESDQR